MALFIYKVIKNLIFKITFPFFIFAVNSCSSNSFQYINKSQAIPKEGHKYHIASLLVELSTKSKKRIFANYPNQEELTEIIREILAIIP